MKNTGAEQRPNYLGYCLVAIVLFSCYVMISGFQDNNSATMAPNLVLPNR